ncbi:MAG: cAMP/cGMP-dependent 3',5'-cyclic-AMP/GMP phosphodiesterase, partial [Pseudomonadota bacterium]
LGRGGVVVQTTNGPIQFGSPPETIKDALAAKLEVPAIYVLPSSWFSRRLGMTAVELEFPVYYNYFLHGRRTLVICDEKGEEKLLAILRESLLGPRELDVSLDYAAGVPESLRANLAKEGEWFRRKPGGGGIELTDVVAFVRFDEDGRARLGQVEISRATVQGEPGSGGGGSSGDGGSDVWQVFDQGRLVAEVDGRDESMVVQPATGVSASGNRAFVPPVFGVTVLGSSHGFDPAGKTTGFVLWANRRGILIDPPSGTTQVLENAGVPAHAVDAIILTHCHADHDAGVMQKILDERRVSFHTTPTILSSFLRKYVALTGESEASLRRLFVFRPVTLGVPQRIHGAEFRFSYSLHSIPTIRFECYLGGKSLFYSADTLFDPARIEAMYQEGVLSRQRRDALLCFPAHHSLAIHEAGRPPIHTPVEVLARLDPRIKSRLRLIHIAESDLPKESGLELAHVGFDESIELLVSEHQHAEALEALDALAAIELFQSMPIERAREFLTIARRETFTAGTLVIAQGEEGDRFYLVVRGEAAIVKNGTVVRICSSGDFFGEAALLTGAPRSAEVRAKTDLVVIAVDKYDFLAFLRGTELAGALVRLAHNRELPSWDLIGENGVLCTLSASQRTQLQALLEPIEVRVGEILGARSSVRPSGGQPDEKRASGGAAWLLDSAKVEARVGSRVVAILGRAAWIGAVDRAPAGGDEQIERGEQCQMVVVQAGRAFQIGASDLAGFLEKNPGIFLSLRHSKFVE